MKQMNLKLSWISMLICMLGFFQLQSCKGKNKDADINAAIQSRTQTDANLTGVNATVADGVVTLTGQCADENCKTNAENAIKGIDGVKKVVNNIAVAPVTITADDPLHTSVQQVIQKYPGAQAEVNDGVITVRGELKREDWQKLRPELDALRPKKVENQLVLK
jgi:hyperosmotically inducible periplasmic protein